MAAKRKTAAEINPPRALYYGINTKRSRRYIKARIKRIRNAFEDIKDKAFEAGDDAFVEQVVENFDKAIESLEEDLKGWHEWMDLPIGEES